MTTDSKSAMKRVAIINPLAVAELCSCLKEENRKLKKLLETIRSYSFQNHNPHCNMIFAMICASELLTEKPTHPVGEQSDVQSP